MNDDELLPTVYSGRWLGQDLNGIPAVSVRAMTREDLGVQREAAEAEARAQDKLEHAVLAARMAGVDTSFAGVRARALRASRADDYQAEQRDLRARIADGEIEDLSGTAPPVSRSDWPENSWEVDRLIREARENRTWVVQYEQAVASRRGHGAEHVEQVRAEADLRRSQATSALTATSEPAMIVRNTGHVTAVW